MPYVDIFLYDIKCIDADRHTRLTGVGNAMILDNLRRLSGAGVGLEVRVPVIEGPNGDDAEMDAVAAYLAQHIRADRVTLMPYHAAGAEKYRRLGRRSPEGFQTPDESRMNELAARFRRAGLPAGM